MDALNLLFYPFLGCVALILIHAYFGIHVLERGIIFVDLSLAQFVALGSAVGLLLSHTDHDQYLTSLLFALIGASILSFSRQIARLVNIEAFIGVLYIFSLAMGFLVLDRTPHGLEEMKSILNGNILWITARDVLYSCLLYGAVGLFHLIFRDKFFKLSFEGRGSLLWEFLFFLSFAIVLVSSVRMAGILQVFSFLVIPALIGRLYTGKRSMVLVIGWLLGLAASILGIALSYWFDLPTAPLIVAALSCLFFVTLVIKAMIKAPRSD
jgi:zinc/manganese transport system permease protein